MKRFFWGLFTVVIIAALGFGGWFFFIKKSAEGGPCRNDTTCETDLKCINRTCSSGKLGSICAQKTDCQSGYCVNSICTEGKEGNACATYKDCGNDLLCTKSICTKKPDYSKYFSKVTVSKMKPGLPPGADNPTTVTTTFTTQDAIEVDITGVKSTTVGAYYFELVDSTTGEIARSTKSMETVLDGRDTGSGTDLSNLAPGEYDFSLYYKDELVYSTIITVKS